MRPAFSLALVTIGFSAAALIAGCSSSAPPPISVTVSPTSAQTDQGLTVFVSANLVNDSKNMGLNWSLSGPGSLSNPTDVGVMYNAPQPSNLASPQTAMITAASIADPTKSAAAQITVHPLPQITALSLPNGNTGAPYSQAVSETGGTQPFTWSIVDGGLPLGLGIASTTGVIGGTPTGGGTWNFDAELVDAAGGSAQQPFLSISIDSNSSAGNPVPFLNQPLVPAAAVPGGSAFTLTANGAGFVQGATINFNGAALATPFVSSRQLTAIVPATDIATAGTAWVSIINPTPGGGQSNVAFLPVAAPEADVNFASAPGSPIANIFSAASIAVGNFRGQRKPDLVAVSFTNVVNILLSNGDGSFTLGPGSPIYIPKPPYDTLPTQDPVFAAVGNFSNSGHVDLAVAEFANESAMILFGDGRGGFTPASTAIFSGNEPAVIGVGDFIGNGNLDLAIANSLGVLTIEQGYGDGAFNALADPEDSLNGVAAVVVGDFNGDGILDLAVTANIEQSYVLVFLGNGDGTFTLAPDSPYVVGANPITLIAADFNGDGHTDLAVANADDNTVSILLGNGDGTFIPAPGSPIAVGLGPNGLAFGDLNSDGKLDLAVANTLDNTVTILLGNGDGTFTAAPSSPIAAGDGPISIAVADFNGSGRLGLAVANLFGNTVSILVQQ
jgi:hypothetical protein